MHQPYADRSRGHNATPNRTFQCLLLLALALLSLNAHAASELDVPYIGEPADRSMSPVQEAQIGGEVMRQLLASNFVLEDAEIEDYVSSLGQRMLRHTNEQGINFRFFMVRDQNINAFALPGGYVGFNAGLLLASESESEVAGVMGHEIAHVTQRHIARSMDSTRGWEVASIALMMAALIAGASDPELAQAALTIGMGTAVQKQINFTRANELEADRLGIKTLAAAGFDPQGMASFFHRLSQKAQLYGESVPEILRTHPVNATRISEAQARAASLPNNNPGDSLQYRLMKARARVLTTELAGDATNYYAAMYGKYGQSAYAYGLALGLTRQRQFDSARAHLSKLLKKFPDNASLHAAMADTWLQQGHYDTAETLLRDALKSHADSRALQLMLADTLIRRERPQAARQLLLESDLLMRNDDEAYRLLALAARGMDEAAEAAFQMSAYSHSRGDYVQAIQHLHNGLRQKDLSDHDKKRLSGRLDNYLREIPESERKRARQQRLP